MTTVETHKLAHLVRLTRDSVDGYREAAELVRENNGQLASLFTERGFQRARLLDMLRERLRILDPGNDALESNGTVSGDLHQSWMKFRSMFQGDAKAALAEVERGETHLIQEYEDAIESVAAETRTLLQDALASLRADERDIETLRRAA